jgi:glycosyltransferase involved in cell wall biosynthesis
MTAAAEQNGASRRPITPAVLTFDEAPNIARCLERLTWAHRVIVLDSGSTDETIAIARRFPNVDIHVRPFDNHADQWNYAIDLAKTPWVLSLDADYVLADGFADALAVMDAADDVDAAFVPFHYVVAGRRLRASLYPPRAVLFRRDRCRYESDGHTQRLRIPGRSIELRSSIDHDDRKSFGRWLRSQRAYARLEAKMLLTTPRGQLSRQDRLRRWILPGPAGAFVHAFVLKGGALDGWRGWYYTGQRTLAELLLSVELVKQHIFRP